MLSLNEPLLKVDKQSLYFVSLRAPNILKVSLKQSVTISDLSGNPGTISKTFDHQTKTKPISVVI